MIDTKHTVSTPFGEIAYSEQGQGPPALFVHGLFLNGHLWRHVIDRVADQRRCIAVDLLGHGDTKTKPGDDMSLGRNADMLEAVCDALELDRVDVVANDTGGAVVQIFAARHPERIRTLTLTNCDAHDNVPPEGFKPIVETVRATGLTELGAQMVADPDVARQALATAYEHPENVDDETIRTYVEPLFATPESTAAIERWFDALEPTDVLAAEPKLRQLHAPTMIVWGTGDELFGIEWAHWLRETIPGATEVVEVPGAKLFFPEERPEELATALREHWWRG